MLPCLLGSPTAVEIGGEPYLARPLTLGGFALLLRNGADALGLEGDAGDLPDFGSGAFQGWLEGAGAYLLLWECLRRDNPVTLADCRRIAATNSLGDLLQIALRRARVATPNRGDGKDVSRLDWARMLYARYEESGSLPAVLADLTLDQAWLLASGGKGFDAADEVDFEAIDAERRRLKGGGGPAAPEAPAAPRGPVPDGVSDEVAREVEAMGLGFAGGSPDG